MNILTKEISFELLQFNEKFNLIKIIISFDSINNTLSEINNSTHHFELFL